LPCVLLPVLPPGEFNENILEPLPLYAERFTTMVPRRFLVTLITNKYRYQTKATKTIPSRLCMPRRDVINPLEVRGNYSATSNDMDLLHWPLMGGLLHLVQRGGDWAGPQPAQAPPRCTKCNSPPINGQCTNHRIGV